MRFNFKKTSFYFRDALFTIVLLFAMTGCYGKITDKVVDAETGESIEGAVVHAEWIISMSFGYSTSKSHKVVEGLTDKDGNITLVGNIFNPLVSSPDVTVYKEGYVAWNNKYIFPDYNDRKGFEWKNGYKIRLEKFKDSYSYDKHAAFVSTAIHAGLINKRFSLLEKIYDEAETKKIREELDRKIGGKKQ